MKPSLSINDLDIKSNLRTLGMSELLTHLTESDLFDVTFHNERIRPMRGERAAIVFYEGHKIYVDFWEYNTPTYTEGIYDENFDLIIKLQHRKQDRSRFHKTFNRKGIFKDKTVEEKDVFLDKIVPWTFFPSRMMKQFVGHEDELEQLPVEQLAFFCGMGWKSRKKMEKKMIDAGMEFTRSKQGHRFGKKMKDPVYLHKMRTSKYGLVLKGRGSHCTEAKNRREIDYMMLKKPILMNYEPHYYNPLVQGEHYILINENTDFNKIEEEYDLDQIAQNGYKWYLESASPNGVCKTFLQIMQDRFE